eukprot:CAMPEP_0184327530 /NCGR_PEP_ID=MMETSP1049-20130417/143137_1 /TAXON_ID=77928 /ORGANISM="Proteomonas sulcata, Strain CCMP704" /LENGTH=52 /DNA_ID=CAMNT_0026649789 /DNA_START=714 /DNA_END=872 /DNA_ORIENTATION=+
MSGGEVTEQLTAGPPRLYGKSFRNCVFMAQILVVGWERLERSSWGSRLQVGD